MAEASYLRSAGGTALTSCLMLGRTREILRVQATGSVRPGSIADRTVWDWRGLAAWILVLTALFVVVVLG